MALTNNRVDVPVIVDENKCLEKCKACIEVCPLDVPNKNSSGMDISFTRGTC